MADLIERQAAIDAMNEVYCHIEMIKKRPVNKTEQAVYLDMIGAVKSVPSAQPEKCSDILDELKADDYYNYIHTGYSRFSEDDWDYLIRNAKEKEKLHERLDIKADGN